MVPIPVHETPQTLSDLTRQITHLTDKLPPVEKLRLVTYIIGTVQPFVVEVEPDDDNDEEVVADALSILEHTPDDAWISLEEFEAELDRAEAAGELPC